MESFTSLRAKIRKKSEFPRKIKRFFVTLSEFAGFLYIKASVSKALIDKMGAKQLKGRRLTVVTGTGTWV